MTRRSTSKGTALVVVMVVVVMMALAVYGFVYLMTNEYRSTAFVVEQSQAKMAANPPPLEKQQHILSPILIVY